MAQHMTAAAEIRQLEERAVRATQAGRMQEAQQAWKRLIELDAGHGRALDAVGDHAFRAGGHHSRAMQSRRVGDGICDQGWRVPPSPDAVLASPGSDKEEEGRGISMPSASTVSAS